MMRIVKDFSLIIFSWAFCASLSPGWLSVGLSWETATLSFALELPFVRLWAERDDDDWSKNSWRWSWSLLRLTVWKTEHRLDLDLNDWSIGLACIELDDFSLHLGPLNIQIETDKFFADEFPPGVPTLGLFFPRGHSIRPWPPRCRYCPPSDRLQCDDVTDFADGAF
jgi:hypothetical protein